MTQILIDFAMMMSPIGFIFNKSPIYIYEECKTPSKEDMKIVQSKLNESWNYNTKKKGRYIQMKKKVLLIIIPIILVFLIIGIIGAIFIGIWLNKSKTVGTTWGDTYYAYLKEAINDKNLGDAEEKYGMQLGMKDAKIGFCDIEENENPSMVMTYSKDGNNYVNVYQINNDNKVVYVAYKQQAELEYLYDIEKDNYGFYIHENNFTSDSYILLKNIVDKLKNNSGKSVDNENINIAEIQADYTIRKDEAEINQETTDGNKLTMNRFEQIFVRPEIKLNDQIDFNIDIKEKELKELITNLVSSFNKESEKLTNEIKENVLKKAEESKNRTNEIENAKKKVNQAKDMKVTQNDIVAKLGDHLKYFSADYLGRNYGPSILYKVQDVTGKVKIPNTSEYEMVEEVVGLASISELENQLKTYLSDEVITKLKTGSWGNITADMHEYNGKVYIVRGGIGDGPAIEWKKAKLISSEGNTTKLELEEINVLGNFVAAKITLTIKYDEENSKFLVTDYTVQDLNNQNNTNIPNNIQTNSQNNQSSTNNSGETSSSQSKLTPFEYDTSVNIKIPEGEYTRENSGPHTGKLKITNVTGNSFNFSFECIYAANPSAPNIGSLEGTAKAIKGNKFVFVDKYKKNNYGYEYEAIFTITGEGDNLKITVTDECYDLKGKSTMNPYSGMNVTFGGTYKK